MPERRTIAELAESALALPPSERAVFQRIFHVSTTTGRLNPPAAMHDWIKAHFGAVERVRSQRIVKITNMVTMEGALFNELRASRPMEVEESADLEKTILSNLGDPFCHPLEGTPEDAFGRIRGQRCITASNIAKYDGFHGLVIFKEHNPLSFTAEGVKDYIDTALAWARHAHETDPQARYFFLMWNCLWKSGASILHGHLQMTLSRDMHYAKVESWRRAARLYKMEYGANYFDDLYRVHQALGLAFEKDEMRVLAYLTPIKEKETLLMAEELTDGLKEAVYKALACFVKGLRVSSFNLAFYLRPFGHTEEDWESFPAIVRLVDRGDPFNKTADIGAMELYASSVISSDPFRLIEALRACF
ncbi:MAG: hypothetical protein ACUVV0_00745 [Anaerolineae bacterium]